MDEGRRSSLPIETSKQYKGAPSGRLANVGALFVYREEWGSVKKLGIRNSVLQRIAANQQRVANVHDREELERAALRELNMKQAKEQVKA